MANPGITVQVLRQKLMAFIVLFQELQALNQMVTDMDWDIGNFLQGDVGSDISPGEFVEALEAFQALIPEIEAQRLPLVKMKA